MSVNVTQHLPRPLKCDNCKSSNVQLCNNEFLYGKSQGAWPLIYLCTDCGAAVSCHPNTDHPMGLMADQQTRRLRGQAHQQFDKLWKQGYTTRAEAYRSLASALMLTEEKCHISMFDADQCKEAIKFAKQRLHELKQLQRGKVYRQGKQTKRKY